MMLPVKFVRNASIVIGLGVLFLLSPVTILADGYGQYGGSPVTSQISLNKMVQDPASGSFVDNLGVNSTRFQAGENVLYRLVITNNGQTSFGFVDITDTLPSYLDFVSGPGDYNTTNRQLTFRIENLTPGASQTEDIHTRVVAQNQLPSDNGVFCLVNAASAVTNTNMTASDTAQICIGQPQSPVSKLPSTGYADYLVPFIALGTIGTGIFLRKAKY